MENLQSEIIFIVKFGGIVAVAATHYFSVIKPIAIFNERQKVTYKLLLEVKAENEKRKSENEEIREKFIKLQTEHDMETCKIKRKSKNT